LKSKTNSSFSEFTNNTPKRACCRVDILRDSGTAFSGRISFRSLATRIYASLGKLRSNYQK